MRLRDGQRDLSKKVHGLPKCIQVTMHKLLRYAIAQVIVTVVLCRSYVVYNHLADCQHSQKSGGWAQHVKLDISRRSSKTMMQRN